MPIFEVVQKEDGTKGLTRVTVSDKTKTASKEELTQVKNIAEEKDAVVVSSLTTTIPKSLRDGGLLLITTG